MDHRWNDSIRKDQQGRVEQGRYGARPVEDDPEVERRDRRVLAQRRINKSPWEIGASHWDQRDLYTKGSAIDDRGYGRGPALHPEVGSYAYERDDDPPPATRRDVGPTVYEREAWPWLNYDRFQWEREQPSLWSRVKNAALSIAGRGHAGRGPKGWRRSDESIREDVCEALAYEGRVDATDITVEVKNGEVTLEGEVADREQKRLAEELAARCRGVEDVHNRLRLHRDEPTAGGGGGDDMTFASPVGAY